MNDDHHRSRTPHLRRQDAHGKAARGLAHGAAAVALVLAACAGDAPAPSDVPDWATLGCEHYWTGKAAAEVSKVAACGVGAAAYSRDERLLDLSAQRRATEAVLGEVHAAIVAVLSGRREGGDAESVADAVVAQLADRTTMVAQHRTQAGAVYALCALERPALASVLSAAPALQAGDRTRIEGALALDVKTGR